MKNGIKLFIFLSFCFLIGSSVIMAMEPGQTGEKDGVIGVKVVGSPSGHSPFTTVTDPLGSVGTSGESGSGTVISGVSLAPVPGPAAVPLGGHALGPATPLPSSFSEESSSCSCVWCSCCPCYSAEPVVLNGGYDPLITRRTAAILNDTVGSLGPSPFTSLEAGGSAASPPASAKPVSVAAPQR